MKEEKKKESNCENKKLKILKSKTGNMHMRNMEMRGLQMQPGPEIQYLAK